MHGDSFTIFNRVVGCSFFDCSEQIKVSIDSGSSFCNWTSFWLRYCNSGIIHYWSYFLVDLWKVFYSNPCHLVWRGSLQIEP
nr:hypothetical protein Iba_scaffold3961.4CG1470 [Ipomoea batatas]